MDFLRIIFDRSRGERIIAEMEGAPTEIKLGLVEAMNASVIKVHSSAVPNAPFKTGTLRRSITFKVEEKENSVEGTVGTNVVYARIQEFGGRAGRKLATRIEGRHYMGRAIDENKEYIRQRFLKIRAIKRK